MDKMSNLDHLDKRIANTGHRIFQRNRALYWPGLTLASFTTRTMGWATLFYCGTP